MKSEKDASQKFLEDLGIGGGVVQAAERLYLYVREVRADAPTQP